MKKYNSFLLIFFLIVIILISATSTFSREPFDSIGLRFGKVHNINHNNFHKFWELSNGYECNIASPLSFGRLDMGLRFFNNNSKQSSVVDYNSFYFYTGWMLQQQLVNKLSISFGGHFGNYIMNFDDDNANPEGKTEHELSTEIFATVKYCFTNSYFITAHGFYQKIYTVRRIHLSYVGFSVGKTFSTPKWLKVFLQ